MQLKGNKNIVANAGGVANQITNINIEGMNAEQFKSLSEQMNQVLAAIGIKDEIGQEPAGVTPEQQVIGEAVRQKVDEVDASFAETAGTPEIYLKLGNFEYDSGNFEKAVEYFNKITAIDPQNDLVWNNKGNALDYLGRKEEAIKCYDKALEFNPQLDAAWNNKGYVLYALGRKVEAIRCFDKALEIKPQYDAAWYNKGCCWGSMGVDDEAYRCFDKAVEINPALQNARKNRDIALNNMKNRG